MGFITVGNKYLNETITVIEGRPPVEWPAPTSEEGLQWWIDRMDLTPNRTLERLAQLEAKGVAWVEQLFELLCRECY